MSTKEATRKAPREHILVSSPWLLGDHPDRLLSAGAVENAAHNSASLFACDNSCSHDVRNVGQAGLFVILRLTEVVGEPGQPVP